VNRIIISATLAILAGAFGYLLAVVLTLANKVVPIWWAIATTLVTFLAAVFFDLLTESFKE